MTFEETRLLTDLFKAYPRVATDIERMHYENIQKSDGEGGIALIDAYEWEHTDQGYDFWNTIHKMLHEPNYQKVCNLWTNVIKMYLDMHKLPKTPVKFDDTRPI